jgi:uncharacterized protein (DUF1800 family)
MHRSLSRRELFVPTTISRAPTASPPVPLLTTAAHVLARATFGATPAAIAEFDAMGLVGWLNRQLAPMSIDDSATEALIAASGAPSANNAPDIRMLARAIFSRRQLQWRMVHFLNNHFSTYRIETAAISETQEDETFAKLCFETFGAVLVASATSPAMIDYLDSQSNIAGSPNENYGRELMELHTMGAGTGYTEADVAAVARVFTGWARLNVVTGGVVTASRFNFRAAFHDTGPKTTSLGWSTPGITGAAGVNEGLSLLAFLAAHPATATRFVTKLCQYFVADQPPAALIARVQQTFTATGGNLRSTVFAIFTDPDFATTVTAKAKVHDGFELVVNAIRRLGYQTVNLANLNTRVGLLRNLPHSSPVPTGYDEVGPEWQGAGNVLSRWDFANDLANDLIGGVVVPWTGLFGPTPPTIGAIWVNVLSKRLVDGEVPATTTLALTVFMDTRLATMPPNPTWTQARPHARALLALMLSLPEFQLH